MNRDIALLGCTGASLEIAILIIYYFTHLDRTSNLLEPFFAIPFIIYLAISVWIVRSTPSSSFRATTVTIIGVSVVLYFTFVLQTPSLSGDVYRYIWDGKLINNGISPYKFAPYASQLAYLRDANWQLVENKNIISPYPPFIELINALTYRISPSVVAFKTVTILGGIGTITILPMLLKKINYDPRLAVLFAWNPLFVLVFGSSGHDDTVALLFVVLSFYFLLSNQKIPSSAMMALGVLSKLFPLLIVPIFLKRWGKRGTSILVAIILALYTPFLFLGGNMFNTVSVYVLSSVPIFNAGIFSLLQIAFSPFGSTGAILLSRIVEYSVFTTALAWMLWGIFTKSVKDIHLLRFAGILISIYVVFSSTLQPWYLSWIFVPFLVIMPTWSWIFFSGAIFLTYYTFTRPPIAPGYWAEVLWVKIVEFVQLYGMIAYEILSRKYFIPKGLGDQVANESLQSSN